MFCEECGKQMPDGAKFCGICGYRMTESVANANPVRSDVNATAANSNPASATEMNGCKLVDTSCILVDNDDTEITEIVHQGPTVRTEIITGDISNEPDRLPSFDNSNQKDNVAQVHNVTFANTSANDYSGQTKEHSNGNKRGILIAVIAAIICVVGIVVAFLLLNTPERRMDNYYSNAAKYLLDMNYEEAIVEFDKILVIDAMNVEAYLGKARAYYEMGESDKAIKSLQEGYQKTGDERIWDYLQEILNKSNQNTPNDIQIPDANATGFESDVEVLLAPTDVTYSSDSNSITLLWDVVDGASAYKILICDESSNEFKEYKTVADPSAKVTDLKPSTEYQIKITTLSIQDGSLCEGETTDVLYCETKEEIKLSAPTNVQYDSDDHSITLKWNKIDGADAYEIWMRNSKNNEFELYTVVITNSCLVDGLNAETEYEFKITTMTTANGVKEHNTTEIVSCSTKETKIMQTGQRLIAVGGSKIIAAVRENGTVAWKWWASNVDDSLDGISSWRNIKAVTASWNQVYGLTNDGTVIGAGYGYDFAVESWTDIVKVDAGGFNVIGLRSDGTVVCTGSRNTQKINDIVDIAAGNIHEVYLKSDGTVIARGDNTHGQCDVSNWSNIVAIATTDEGTIGLRSDGCVLTAGDSMGDTSSWNDIVAIATDDDYTIGLKSNGTIVMVENYGVSDDVLPIYIDNNNWRNIVAIDTFGSTIIGLKSDGTVVSQSADNDYEDDDIIPDEFSVIFSDVKLP